MATRKGNHEGNIRKRKDGRWETRIVNGVNFATGEPIRISKCFRTRQEAVEALHKIECQINAGAYQGGTQSTLSEWYSYWLETYKKNMLKPSTYISYEGYLRIHLEPSLGKTKLENLTGMLLQEFFNYKYEEEDLSPKTIANIHRALHECLGQAVKLKIINDNPTEAVILPRHNKKEIEVFTLEQQQALMTASYQNRYGVFVRLALCTGLRIGELVGLQWPDIDLARGGLYIRRTMGRLHDYDEKDGSKTKIIFGEPKTKNSKRYIPLPQSAQKELKEWRDRQNREAKLAGDAYSNPMRLLVTNETGGLVEPRTFRDHYEKMLATADLPHFTCHALRHTFATRALERKMDFKTLSMILGHSSVAFTMDTYAHVQDDLKRQAMDLMDDMYVAQ